VGLERNHIYRVMSTIVAMTLTGDNEAEVRCAESHYGRAKADHVEHAKAGSGSTL
jgi:hypothetical protein